MDFKTFVNKESFKATLLQHLKNQVKQQFGHAISKNLKECSENLQGVSSPDHIISSISKDVTESDKFSEFSSKFVKNVDSLLADGDAYVPKDAKQLSNSQCSSASSFNVSSIDFMSPDQFHDILQSLTRGTNAEKLEALGALHRLPSLEHISQQGLWSDIEVGLYECLSSSIIFLKEQSLKLYIKMLSCPEPKVVLESYLSLIKYLLDVLLPSLNAKEKLGQSDWSEKNEIAVKIITILNQFLQNISTHWIRYPQSMIESITMHSLKVLLTEEIWFPSWMCVALCDPEAKWLKNIMHGYISRAALLNSLVKHKDILLFAVDFCDKFNFNEISVRDEINYCCKKRYLVAEITHMVCFLSQLLQYSDGHEIFKKIDSGKIEGNWMNVLGLVMTCAHKLCETACFKCCATVCDVVSGKWCHVWTSSVGQTSKDNLIQLLTFPSTSLDYKNVNNLYLTILCLIEIVNTSDGLSDNLIDKFMLTILTFVVDCCDNHEMVCYPTSVMHLFNSSLILVKQALLVPSRLFFNSNFIESFLRWLCTVKHFSTTKVINNTNAVSQLGFKFASEIDWNVSSIFIQLLRKPFTISIALKSSVLEICINVLLEKVLKDIKSNGYVCSCDISILSFAMNSLISPKSVLSETSVLRISSVIWQLNEQVNNFNSAKPIQYVLEMLIPSIFCDLLSIEVSFKASNPDPLLFYFVLLFPNKGSDFAMQEDMMVLAFQVISFLSFSVHCMCVLESKFKVTQMLLELLNNHPTIEENQIIDPVSILANHILVKLYTVGGPNERKLPPENLEDGCYNWPFVTQYSVLHSEYYQEPFRLSENIDSINGIENENIKDILLRYLQLDQLPHEYFAQLLKDNVDALFASSQEFEYNGNLQSISLNDVELTLHDEELMGLKYVKRYGSYLSLINEDDDKLEQLLKASKLLIGAEGNPNLDVFVCALYLLCKGDSETCFLLLNNLAKSYLSFFLWTEYLIQASLQSSSQTIVLHNVVLELCDIVVKEAFPDVYLIFQAHGLLPSTLYSYWNKQCYWNYLNFKEVSYFVLLSIQISGDFALYFFCSVLKHIHQFILQNAHERDFYNLIMKNYVKDFKVSDYVNYMFSLEKQFHDFLTKSIMQVLKLENP